MKNLSPLLLCALILTSCGPKVPAEILNSFRSLNQSLERSNAMLESKNERAIKLLESERKNQPEKVEKLMTIARDIRTRSSDLNNYIDSLFRELNKSDKDGDMRVGTRLLAQGKEGDLLKTKLEKYKEDINNIMKEYPLPAEAPIDVSSPKGEGGQTLAWRMAFHNVPKVAAISILNKLRNDIKTTEAMCLDRLSKEVSVPPISDRLVPLVSAKSSYILLGDHYTATIGLGAYSTAIVPEVYVGGRRIPVKNFIATYTTTATAAGTFKVPTLVRIPKPSGGFEDARGELEYTVVAK